MAIKLTIVWNKADLQPNPPKELTGYRTLGYATVSTATRGKEDIRDLSLQLEGSISMLVGQSGVGKSSLINKLVPEADATVGENQRPRLRKAGIQPQRLLCIH